MPTTGSTSGNAEANKSTSSPPLPTQFEACHNWIVYQARIEQYFVAYDIETMERQRAILLTSLSTDVYEILMKLCFPDVPESKTLKDLYGILKKRFTPVICVLNERVKFYDAKQNNGESISEFETRLRGLSRHCKFDAYLKDVLRDKFINGLTRGPVANKVLELEHTVSFEECIEVALKKEVAVNNRDTSEVYKIDRSSSKVCSVCGKANHGSQVCRYQSYECKLCKTKGHLAKMCKKKKDSESKFMVSDSDTDTEESLNHFGLY